MIMALPGLFSYLFLVTGLVTFGIRPSLSFKGVYLLLGNNLAGDKVVVNPLLNNIPCIDQPLDPLSRKSLIFIHRVPLEGPWQRKQNRIIGTLI